MKLVKCQIGKDNETLFDCPVCGARLKDTGEDRKPEPVVFLCPKCHHIFNKNGGLSQYEVETLFPGVSNIYD